MMRLNFFLGPIIVLILVLYGDQFSKSLILDYFKLHPQPYEIFPILDFVLVWNHGISWGMFNQASSYNALIFSSLSAMITLGLVIYLYKARDLLKAYALSLIISGAVGNLVDRVRFSGVIDFIHFHWNAHSFPAFNVADTAITIGAFLLILDEWFINGKKKQNV